MFTYWKMKKNEHKVKSMLYGALAALIDNQKDILELLQRLYLALKDVPAEKLREEFTAKLAELIHDENKNANN